MSDHRRVVRVRRRTDEDDDPDVRAMTPVERIEMMWQLALDAWAVMGTSIRDPRVPRNVVRVIRKGREA